MALEKIWLLEIDCLNQEDQFETLYFSSGSYISPENIYYENRLKQPALYTSSAFAGDLIKSGSRSAFGEAVVINTDGALNYLADYSIDGRELRIFLYDQNTTEKTTIIVGTVNNVFFGSNLVSFRLRDPQEILNLDDPEELYLGNNVLPNGLEGTETDIKGRIKPKVFGVVKNADPIQVNSAKLIYQVQSLSLATTVTAVYDRGIALTRVANNGTENKFMSMTVPSGSYTQYRGYIRLGAAPTGELTCDVETNIKGVGDVFNYISSRQGYYLRFEELEFLNAVGNVGFYIRDKKKTSDLLDTLARSIGGYWVINNDNSLSAKLLSDPNMDFDFEVFDYQIFNIQRDSVGSGSNGIPVYSVTVRADRIERTQNDLAAAVTAERKARLSLPYREATSTYTYVKDRHPLSESVIIESVLSSVTDAERVSSRLLRLLSRRRDSVTVDFNLNDTNIANVAIGSTVKLYSKKFGYNDGKNFVVLGFTIDARTSKGTLFLWGSTSQIATNNLFVNINGDYLLISNLGGVLLNERVVSNTENNILFSEGDRVLISDNPSLEFLRTR